MRVSPHLYVRPTLSSPFTFKTFRSVSTCGSAMCAHGYSTFSCCPWRVFVVPYLLDRRTSIDEDGDDDSKECVIPGEVSSSSDCPAFVLVGVEGGASSPLSTVLDGEKGGYWRYVS